MTVSDKDLSGVPSTCPDIRKDASSAYKTRLFYNSWVQPSAVEAALARHFCVNEKVKNCVKSHVFWAGGKYGGDQSIVKGTQKVIGNGQGEKLSNNTHDKDRDVAGLSHGVECVLMHHSTHGTAFCNNVVPDIEHVGQQDVNRKVPDRDYLSLNPGITITGRMGLSPSCSANGQDGLNQAPLQESDSGSNLNTLDEDKDRADSDGLSHCERSQLKLLYDIN